MLDAVVGAVIIVVATSSLLYSIEVAQRVFDQAGKYPLNDRERSLLQRIGIKSISDQNTFKSKNIDRLPDRVFKDEL